MNANKLLAWLGIVYSIVVLSVEVDTFVLNADQGFSMEVSCGFVNVLLC